MHCTVINCQTFTLTIFAQKFLVFAMFVATLEPFMKNETCSRHKHFDKFSQPYKYSTHEKKDQFTTPLNPVISKSLQRSLLELFPYFFCM